MNISIGARASRPDKPSCFCPACTVTECIMKKEGKRKMEKFKRGLLYIIYLVLPPFMLVLLVVAVSAILNLGLQTIGLNLLR